MHITNLALGTTQLSQNFITINNTKSPDTVIKIIPHIIILKAILFIFLHFSKMNGHKMDKRTEINSHLTISTRTAPQNMSTQAAAWFNCAVTPTLKNMPIFGCVLNFYEMSWIIKAALKTL